MRITYAKHNVGETPGKGGEISTNRLEDQELSVLSLYLLQIA